MRDGCRVRHPREGSAAIDLAGPRSPVRPVEDSMKRGADRKPRFARQVTKEA